MRWLLGVEVTVLVFAIGTLIVAFRNLATRIDEGKSEAKKGDDALHERVNRVRDEYVKRIDLDGHMGRMETTVKELREEAREGTREINRRLDQVLTTLQPSDRSGRPRS
jgi:hypothetical protein